MHMRIPTLLGALIAIACAPLASAADQPPAGALQGGVIAAPEVAARVVRGIVRNDLYILTPPEQRELLRRRAARHDEAAQW